MQDFNIPVIHNWKQFATYRHIGSEIYLWGQVYNDKRYKNGTVIRTSRADLVDVKSGILITKNTTYYLGMEYKED